MLLCAYHCYVSPIWAIPYNGKLLREKNFETKFDFYRENFRGLLTCVANGYHAPQNFEEKTWQIATKFTKVFTLKNFSLYGSGAMWGLNVKCSNDGADPVINPPCWRLGVTVGLIHTVCNLQCTETIVVFETSSGVIKSLIIGTTSFVQSLWCPCKESWQITLIGCIIAVGVAYSCLKCVAGVASFLQTGRRFSVDLAPMRSKCVWWRKGWRKLGSGVRGSGNVCISERVVGGGVVGGGVGAWNILW